MIVSRGTSEILIVDALTGAVSTFHDTPLRLGRSTQFPNLTIKAVEIIFEYSRLNLGNAITGTEPKKDYQAYETSN
jgi:hypothetical protein